ncbi:hypothetical protein [Chryseobacterium proteolyticum]|uniref:hypothetical protein n=1 Tax=Chryseobacterium proteolyticum TaxID=118127 RepID=UPI0039831904
MAVYILSNRKIVRHKNETVDSFSNDEYSIPNFRIAKCDFTNYTEPTAQEKRKKKLHQQEYIKLSAFFRT